MSMLEDIKAAEKAADELKKEKTAAARTLLRDAQEEARKEADALVAKAQRRRPFRKQKQRPIRKLMPLSPERPKKTGKRRRPPAPVLTMR